MTSLIGQVGEFHTGEEDWRSYLERLQYYFAANNVGAEKQRDTLLCCIGRETFGLLKALVAPAKLSDKTFKELTETLTAHMAPKPLVIAERFRFHKREQKTDETIRAYAASLQKLAEHCEFGNALDDTLRDRLVCGMKNEKVQRRLLIKRDLSFAAVVEETEIGEMAEKDVAQFHGANTMPAEVHQIHVPKKGIRVRCYRCDGAHDARECWVTQEQCRYCKKRGHIERACRAKRKDQGEERPREDQRGDKRGDQRGERPRVKPLRRNKIKEVAYALS